MFNNCSSFRTNVLNRARFRHGTFCATGFVTREALVVGCVIEASAFGIAFEVAFGFRFVGRVSAATDNKEDGDEQGAEQTGHGKLLSRDRRRFITRVG